MRFTILFPDSEVKPVYHHRKFCYEHHRSQRDYPIKKRKFYYDRSSVPNPDRGMSCKGITSFPRKKFTCDTSGSSATMCGGFSRLFLSSYVIWYFQSWFGFSADFGFFS